MICIPKHSVLRPHGTGTLSDPDAPRDVHRDFLQCVHCQGVWEVSPGSGRRRGFCTRCAGPVCGTPACGECRGPWEKRIEMIEKAGR